jgi:hypothetical protein
VFVVEEVNEPSLLFERVAALDLGKAALTACVRIPHPDKPGARLQEVREYTTFTPGLAQYTLGATLDVLQSDRWTHKLVAGIDGYRLRGEQGDGSLSTVASETLCLEAGRWPSGSGVRAGD